MGLCIDVMCGVQCLTNHGVCRCCTDCFRRYVDGKLSEHTTVIQCPSSCSSVVTHEALRGLLEPAAFAKLERIAELKHSVDLRECPSCKAIVKGSPSRPEMCCGQCSTAFCYYHGLMHALRMRLQTD